MKFLFLLIFFKKLEKLEDENETNYGFFIASFNSMKSAYMKMKDIDTLGSFESDDESGSIFAEIKSAMNSLNDEFNLDNNVEETEGRN